ncbi:EF-hand domain-containing protein [Lignipirellula cremea]|uniref:Transaldolase/EF-hand domain-containing protein n=1 Tax=Lignipirellula cremea TaxID=2528010 RepID=A0A518DNB6_9BACT|nr:hypothetical protein [Lignipirellula cremea]QDU93336.1 transaldolase/EF-hand domain-containing protein [Lignipirellula cremea]
MPQADILARLLWAKRPLAPLLAVRWGWAACLGMLLAGSTAWGQGGFDLSGILRRMDANQNGQLEPNEVSERARRFVDRLAEKAELDPSQPLPLEKLLQSYTDEKSGDGDKSRDGDRDSRSSRFSGPSKSEPLVGSFGVGSELPVPPGFDIPADSPLASPLPLAQRYDAKVIEDAEKILARYDKNGDQLLDREEWEKARWRSDPRQSDLNRDGKLSKTELCERVAQHEKSRSSSSSSSSGSSRGYSSSRSSGGSSSSSGGSSSSSDSTSKYRRYAESLLKQYDTNKNGVLEKDEWRGESANADSNNDSVVTLDELTVRLSNYSKDSGSSSSSSGSSSTTASSTSSSRPSSSSRSSWSGRSSYSRSSYSRSSSRDKKDEEPKSYRFLAPTERLPSGLPDWFARNDADGDGQIKMAEYSAAWTKALVDEFIAFDRDGNGFITPEEALAAEEEKK